MINMTKSAWSQTYTHTHTHTYMAMCEACVHREKIENKYKETLTGRIAENFYFLFYTLCIFQIFYNRGSVCFFLNK